MHEINGHFIHIRRECKRFILCFAMIWISFKVLYQRMIVTDDIETSIIDYELFSRYRNDR